MRKLRWLKAHTSLTTESIKNKINKFQYSEKSGEGFTINKVRPFQIDATFIERIESTETIRTPNDSIITQKYINYHNTSFLWNTENKFIEIYQPTRRCGYFLNRLCEICNFDLSTEDYKSNPLKWLKQLEESTRVAFSVTRIRIDNIQLDGESTADTVIRGTNDIRSKISLISTTNDISPRKLSARIIHENRPITIILHDNGIAEISEHTPDSIKLHISEALQTCSNS